MYSPSGGGTPPRSSSPVSRGRSHSPVPIGIGGHSHGSPRGPPSYARSSLDRSPNTNNNRSMSLNDQPRVPPPIFLRSSSPQGQSSKGTLKIHVPAWGVVLVRPPRLLDLHPLEGQSEPPSEDTVLSGSLEVIMKERRRVQAISVGVQSVCRLHMGEKRGWEEDGVFERGVEVLGGDSEGIWLEKGSQTFTFALLLPATLATHDHHRYGRVSYILTARVEGIPAKGGISSIFKREGSSSRTPSTSDIPFKEDFDNVIARSDKLAQDIALHRADSRGSSFGATLTPPLHALHISPGSPPADDSAIAMGDASPSLTGLYHRRQSADISYVPPLSLGQSPLHHNSVTDDARSVLSLRSTGSSDPGVRSEKTGWLTGDLLAARSLIVHANPGPTGGVSQLDIRKEGFVAGLGSWRFTASADVFSISAVLLLTLSIPAPDPRATIFFCRLLVTQSYCLHSPRTPNAPPHAPEAPKHHVIYQVGKPHRHNDRRPGHSQESLWRGPQAGGIDSAEDGWKTKAVARMPNHEKIRPSTSHGTVTPIRVSHEVQLQVFYSVEGETVAGMQIQGPGELRMMAVKLPVIVPSCCCSTSSLDLPTYSRDSGQTQSIDDILNGPPDERQCMCGHTFAELGEAAMKRLQRLEREEAAGGIGAGVGAGSRSGLPGEEGGSGGTEGFGLRLDTGSGSGSGSGLEGSSLGKDLESRDSNSTRGGSGGGSGGGGDGRGDV
ncbi:hypothetical protein BCR39DRAFT_511144 [Naematelia encephala]|uniref:Arrestin-like N-terminal domain-containing protein n=1 Tax=Naematelia encephala TaxID=71784 RepID=A0A1Y2BLG3_9TREE|nr:hypothetical protein BCR39DRAFT_511144 [Naematelia encephala]